MTPQNAQTSMMLTKELLEHRGKIALLKLPGWEAALSEYIIDVSSYGMNWAVQDCLIFTSGGIEAMTGVSLYGTHNDFYDDALSAARYLKSLGFTSLQDLFDQAFVRIPLYRVGRGDIILTESGDPEIETKDPEVFRTMFLAAGIAQPPHYFSVANDGIGLGDIMTVKAVYRIAFNTLEEMQEATATATASTPAGGNF